MVLKWILIQYNMEKMKNVINQQKNQQKNQQINQQIYIFKLPHKLYLMDYLIRNLRMVKLKMV